MVARLRQQPCRPGLDLAQKAGPGPPQKKKKRGYGLLGRQSAQPDQAGVDWARPNPYI